MTPNRDSDIPVKLLPVFHCDAASGNGSIVSGVGHLARDERLLSPFVANAAEPVLRCTLHFSPTTESFDSLVVAGMVLKLVATLSDAEKTLGGTGLEPRESVVSSQHRTLTLQLVPSTTTGATERLQAIRQSSELQSRVRLACPAARVEIAA
jgi:hypothetical protein